MDIFNPVAFGAGMIALINPCGFALLPAYLGMFLGQKDDAKSTLVSLNRAQGVGFALTLGIMLVFGFVGVVFGGLQSSFAELLPYFNIFLGVALVALGIAMLFGFELAVKMPKLNKGGKDGSFGSMFLFGVSYAVASLSCTLPVFISIVGFGSTAAGGSFVSSLGGFLSYGFGMGLLATVLTLLLALGRRELVNKFRALLPKINIFSAILLILVGPYVFLYGIWELQVFAGGDITPWIDSVISRGEAIQGSLQNWFSQRNTIFGREMSRTAILGWPFVAINVALIAAGFVARRARKSGSDDMDGSDLQMADA